MKKLVFAGALSLLPVLALAQNGGSVQGIIQTVIDLINRFIIPLIIGLAMVYFLWGVVQYIIAGGDEEKKSDGKSKIIYGIIALFVMVAVWGLVAAVGGSIGVSTNSPPPPTPQVRF